MSRTPSIAEALESRTLMSASAGVATVFNSAVVSDRLQVRVDLLKFESDCFGCAGTLLADMGAIKAADAAQAKTVVPLIKTLHSDVNQMRLTLKADRLTEASNVIADELKIVGVRKHMLADKGNESAEAADKAQLQADRVQMQNDMIAGLTTRLETRENAYQKISHDGQAILAAVQTDPNATPKLEAAAQKWVDDKTTAMNTMEADLQKLIGDRTQLVNDLTASQSDV
jgi:hypothetical protein